MNTPVLDVAAQAFGELNIGDVRARFFSNGRVAYDTLSGLPHFEVPQVGGAHANFSGGLWIGGQTPGGQLHLSSTMYDTDNSMHFFPGPLMLGDGTTDETTSQTYDQVWSVTREQISTHLAYFNCLSDPNCVIADEFPNGYTIPSAIADWPAMGDVSNGYDVYLAPFYDYNLDGNYNAGDGDAPCILGDQALFSVFSDYLGYANANVPLRVEVHQMPFAYASGDPALDQTVFVRYHLMNRSTQTYANTMLGFFNDFDLGCANDDFIGCDPSRNLAYAYNWDDVDENCLGAVGYGGPAPPPPAFGMVLLKGPLVDANASDDPVSDDLPNWNGHGFDDAIVDNERYGLAHFMYFNRNSPNNCCNDPVAATHYYNYLRGIWKDGVTMTYGGSGYSLDPNAVQCAFMYPDDDDPVGAGTGGIVQPSWSETVQTPATPDRRGLMSMGYLTLEPGQHMDLMFAYVYARAATGDAESSVIALQQRVDSVRAFAQTLPIWNVFEDDGFGGQCEDYAFLGFNEPSTSGSLTLFPSPAATQVSFVAPAGLIGGKLLVRDALGRLVAVQRIIPERNVVDIAALARGVYTCEAVSARARFTGRIVKE